MEISFIISLFMVKDRWAKSSPGTRGHQACPSSQELQICPCTFTREEEETLTHRLRREPWEKRTSAAKEALGKTWWRVNCVAPMPQTLRPLAKSQSERGRAAGTTTSLEGFLAARESRGRGSGSGGQGAGLAVGSAWDPRLRAQLVPSLPQLVQGRSQRPSPAVHSFCLEGTSPKQKLTRVDFLPGVNNSGNR